LTAQGTRPREGDNGSRYFNVEGVKNENHASYGVLVFELSKGGDRAGELETMNLRLVRSVALLEGRAGQILPGLERLTVA
jgi:hypothetical protein